MQKLQSAMAGEQEPLRRLGYALDEATIKQVALNHGITENVTNMSQAQKAQLRYIAIMEQSTNAMGDMARTIESPANQIRILESRIQTLKRAIGDSLMPVVSAALPYVTAFVQIVGEAFRNLAEFMGFELPKFDYSDLITKDNKVVADSFDEATAASKAFKGTLSSIDQLNIIGSKSETSTGTGNNLGADLNLELPSYDFLGNLKNETSEAYNTLKDFWKRIQPIVTGAAAAIASIFAIKGVSDFIDNIDKIGSSFKSLGSSTIGKIATGILAGVTAFFQMKNVVKDLVTGKGSFGALATSIGLVVTAAGAFVALGNPIGAILTVVGAGIGALVGYEQGLREVNARIADTIMYADNGGISLSGLADGFSSYFDTITNGYDDIIENSNAMQANRDKIENAATEIFNLTEKYRNLGGEISAENAETIKGNIETIGNAVSENLGTFTQGIVETLQGKFHDFATQLGLDVDDMVGKFYLLESMGNTALADVKKQAQQLVTEISSGNLSAEEMVQKMNELDKTVKKMGGSTNATAESVGFARALKNMDFAGIDFTNESEVKQIISEFGDKANAARATINEAWDTQIMDLQNTKQQYINLGIDVEFDARFGKGSFNKLFEGAEEALNAGYGAELKKIDVGQGAFLAMVQEQLDKNIQQSAIETAPTFGDYLGANVSNLFTLKGINFDLITDKAEASNLKRITEQFAGTQEVIDNAASGLDFSAYSDIGKYLLEGLANGAIKGQEDLNNALDAAARGAMDEFRAICGIASPSKVFAEYGGYLMKGLAVGIDKNQNSVLSSLDDTTRAMERQMQGLEFDIPVYTEEDVDKTLNATWRGSFGSMQGTAQAPQYQGADRQAMTDAGNAYAQNGIPINVEIALQSYVELDGEQVGQAAAQYQQQQMAYSNGY